MTAPAGMQLKQSFKSPQLPHAYEDELHVDRAMSGGLRARLSLPL